MTIIDSNKKICTLINVFTIHPEECDSLVTLLKDATEQVMKKLPGYISANLHISVDRKTITNYAQWASVDDFNAMQKNPAAQKHMKKAASMVIDCKPVLYGEIWTDTPAQ